MIGLCTPFKINNYGTKLQAYAVQEKIKSMGYDCEIIDFDRRSDMRINKLVSRYANIFYIKNKFKKLSDKKSNVLKENIVIRNDSINSFDLTHFKKTKLIKGYSNLKKISKKYDAVICGSDQIWLPTSINNPTASLDFLDSKTRSISFAPSFGISTIPANLNKKYRKFLSKIDYISVREDTGAKIINNILNKRVDVVLDPTLTVDRKVWDELVDSSNYDIDKKYVFCYFLGTNEEHRKIVYEFAKEKDLTIVTLPHFKEYCESDEKYSDIRLYDVTPCDFIKLIKESQYVFTDSFHSTVFSILYHKNFFTFERFLSNDVNSANSRIYNLLKMLKLEDRILKGKIENNVDIDYTEVDKLLNNERKKTNNFLESALNGLNKVEKKNFDVLEKDECCGCGACVSICPKKCIKFVIDKKTGFRYPEKSNKNDCINCGLCENVCPNRTKRNVKHSILKAYFSINNDLNIREKSASGGIFYPIAKYVLEQKGYVCGAAYDENFNVHHIMINNLNDLTSIIGSKYVESDLNNIFSEILSKLKLGKLVLFSGTPCQIHGLKLFLRKDYENLITVDLLCYGIQSPMVWNKYKQGFDKKIKNINMRDKSKSWQNYSMKIEFEDGTVYINEKSKDAYLKSYSKGLYVRPNCFKCHLKAFPRKSDITIGDYWDIDDISKEKNDGRGAGIVFINSEFGNDIINILNKKKEIKLEEIDGDKLKKIHPLFCLNSKKNPDSEKLYKYLQKGYSLEKSLEHCKHDLYKQKLKKIIKKIKR